MHRYDHRSHRKYLIEDLIKCKRHLLSQEAPAEALPQQVSLYSLRCQLILLKENQVRSFPAKLQLPKSQKQILTMDKEKPGRTTTAAGMKQIFLTERAWFSIIPYCKDMYRSVCTYVYIEGTLSRFRRQCSSAHCRIHIVVIKHNELCVCVCACAYEHLDTS